MSRVISEDWRQRHRLDEARILEEWSGLATHVLVSVMIGRGVKKGIESVTPEQRQEIRLTDHGLALIGPLGICRAIAHFFKMGVRYRHARCGRADTHICVAGKIGL